MALGLAIRIKREELQSWNDNYFILQRPSSQCLDITLKVFTTISQHLITSFCSQPKQTLENWIQDNISSFRAYLGRPQNQVVCNSQLVLLSFYLKIKYCKVDILRSKVFSFTDFLSHWAFWAIRPKSPYSFCRHKCLIFIST